MLVIQLGPCLKDKLGPYFAHLKICPYFDSGRFFCNFGTECHNSGFQITENMIEVQVFRYFGQDTFAK